MVTKLLAYLYAIADWADMGANTLAIGLISMFVKIPAAGVGDPRTTVSKVFAQLRVQTDDVFAHHVGCVGCKVLTWLFHWGQKVGYDHCVDALLPPT